MFLNKFYRAVREDRLIGPVFLHKIDRSEWQQHLTKMYSFWTAVLLREVDYKGNPFAHHIGLQTSSEHFDRWITIFEYVIKTNFSGVKANQALERAHKIRHIFDTRLSYMNANRQTRRIQ